MFTVPAYLSGKVFAPPQFLGGEDGRTPWGKLELNVLGGLTLNGQILAVPFASENRSFGVAFCDAGALPKVFRPRHAQEGGILVAYVDRISPLAVAGLKPFDRVERIGGVRPETVQDAVTRLKSLGAGEVATLDVMKPEGAERMEAPVLPDYGSVTHVEIPFLFDTGGNWTATYFVLGDPLSLLAFWSGLTNTLPGRHRHVSSTSYHRLFKWGIGGDLLSREHWTQTSTGRETVIWRLFWFLQFGGDEAQRPQEATS